ncbi:MAG: alginate lyase family protein [Syntrophales bacterium]|jgi:hypothetical protein
MLPGRNLRSYLARARNASLPEITYRVNQALAVRRLRDAALSGAWPVRIPPVDPPALAALQMPHLEGPGDPSIIEAILRGMVFTLNTDPASLAGFKEACGGQYFADIRSDTAPDIRTVWEPARLQHLTLLCAQIQTCADSSRVDTLRQFAKDSLLGWLKENPFLTGPHYMSPMECGLRIPVFFYCLKSLECLTAEEQQEILSALYLHAWWVARNLSLYSSLGNHTVCECIGLVFAGAVFREDAEGKEWLNRANDLLEQEVTHQVLADGGPAEQSLAYHRFVLDLYWLAADFLERNRLKDCMVWKDALLRGERFLKAFAADTGLYPSIGDSDGGYAVAPGMAPARGNTENVPAGVFTFPDAGYTVLRTAPGAVLTFDHGPLGMTPLYNHGHADALSITLSASSRPFLVDPGTYRYNGAPEYRSYFKGSRAHNTVTVDGEDQAVQETGFVWARPYRADLTHRQTLPDGVVLEARHDGYARLRGRVIHLRRITAENGLLMIDDRFEGEGVHDFELNFHLHPDVQAQRVDGLWRLTAGDQEVFIRMLRGPDFLLVSGQENPPFGWFSPDYGIKVKSCVLCCRKRGVASAVTFQTSIGINRSIPPNAAAGRVETR